MEEIKIPFSQQIYDEASDKIHFVRIVQNSPEASAQNPDLAAFPYLIIVNYKDQIVAGFETLPGDIAAVRKLLRTCLSQSKQLRKTEQRAARWLDNQDTGSSSNSNLTVQA